MKKRNKVILSIFLLLVFVVIAFLVAYRYVGVGGRIIKMEANPDKGFYAEYYLFIPDTLETADHTFLLVETNNTGATDDDHKRHMNAAYDTIRFGQANRIAHELGIPLLIPCFDRPATNWQMYTHALDRDTLLFKNDSLARIDRQLNGMIDDVKLVLAEKDIYVQDKFLLNGFSASGSFANRFTALYPERVAAVAAGGINCMTILPIDNLQDCELIYPVGIADVKQIAEVEFQPSAFADVPQYYYMGAADENDTLPFDDAFSQPEREIILNVLGEEMSGRWEKCKKVYESQGIAAEFRMFPGVGHETTAEINGEIVAFFMKVMKDVDE